MSLMQSIRSDFTSRRPEAIRNKIIKNDTIFYEVKWKGLPESSNSIETIEHIREHQDLVSEFEKKLYKKRKSQRSRQLIIEPIPLQPYKDVIVIDSDEEEISAPFVSKSANKSREGSNIGGLGQDKSKEVSLFLESRLFKNQEKSPSGFFFIEDSKTEKNENIEFLRDSQEEDKPKEKPKEVGGSVVDCEKKSLEKKEGNNLLLSEFNLKMSDINIDFFSSQDSERRKSLESQKNSEKKTISLVNIPDPALKKSEKPSKKSENIKNQTSSDRKSEKKSHTPQAKKSSSKSREKHHNLRHKPRKRSRSPSKSPSAKKDKSRDKMSKDQTRKCHQAARPHQLELIYVDKKSSFEKKKHSHSKQKKHLPKSKKISKNSKTTSKYYRHNYSHYKKESHNNSKAAIEKKSSLEKCQSLQKTPHHKKTLSLEQAPIRDKSPAQVKPDAAHTVINLIEPINLPETSEKELNHELLEPEKTTQQEKNNIMEGQPKNVAEPVGSAVKTLISILEPLNPLINPDNDRKMPLESGEKGESTNDQDHISKNKVDSQAVSPLISRNDSDGSQYSSYNGNVRATDIKDFLNDLKGKRVLELIKEFRIETLLIGNPRRDKVQKVKSLIIEKRERKYWYAKVDWEARKNKDHMGPTILPFQDVMKASPEKTAWFLTNLMEEEIKRNLF